MKKIFIGGGIAIGVVAIVVACGGGGSGSSGDPIFIAKGTVVQNVTVVNTRDGSLSSGMNVIVDDGKIANVTTRSVKASGTAAEVDGSGKYMVPGFNDMHTHSMAVVDAPQTFWPQMLANGITGIREMGGSAALITRAHQLNADSLAGKVNAPEVLQIPGTIYAANPPAAADAVTFLKTQKAAGADFFKMTAGTRDAVLAILAEAKSEGFGVAGHLAPAVSALDSSNNGWTVFEHLGAGWGLILDCSTDEAAIRAAVTTGGQAAQPPFPATFVTNPRIYDGAINAQFYQRMIDTYSDAKCQAVADAFVRNGTWQATTLIRLRTQDYGNDPVYTADPNLVYIDKTTRALWASLAQQYTTNLSPAAIATLRNFYELQKKVTKMMKQRGVKMLAGSDVTGQWVLPGFGLHQEFRELAAAGLSPLEILQMTTLNAAEFLGRSATMGTVETGKNGDLVLLDDNPVASVANLDKVSGLFLKGRYFSKAALDKMKADTAANYAAQSLNPLLTALDPLHVD